MESVDDAVLRLNAALELDPKLRIGGLCFYGSWEGGRRGENWYVLESCSAEGDALKLGLKGGRELVVHGFEGLEVWKTSITIRAVERFEMRYGSGQDREIRPPSDWPRHSSDLAFEFAV